jgi:hypothetical protein
MDDPAQNKMITGSAAPRWFHFSGDGIYHNLAILAHNAEEATSQWLEKRRLIKSPASVAEETSQSTPAPESEIKKDDTINT